MRPINDSSILRAKEIDTVLFLPIYLAIVTWGLFAKKTRVYDYIVIVFFCLIALNGTNGQDFAYYQDNYLHPEHYAPGVIEPGWQFLCSLFRSMGFGYGFFYAIMTLFSLLIILAVIRWLDVDRGVFWSCLLICPGLMNLVQFRQFVAMAIGLAAITCLAVGFRDKEPLRTSNNNYIGKHMRGELHSTENRTSNAVLAAIRAIGSHPAAKYIAFIGLVWLAAQFQRTAWVLLALLLVPLLQHIRSRLLKGIVIGTLVIIESIVFISPEEILTPLVGSHLAHYFHFFRFFDFDVYNKVLHIASACIIAASWPAAVLCESYIKKTSSTSDARWNQFTRFTVYGTALWLLLIPTLLYNRDFLRLWRYIDLPLLVCFAMVAARVDTPKERAKVLIPIVVFSLIASYVTVNWVDFARVTQPLLTPSAWAPLFL